jgi:hypothetical protein
MDYALAAIVGIGLAAACGLRAFVPVLGMALAGKAGWITLGPSFEWLASWPAIAGLTLACSAEVTASLVPWVSHALDALAAPVAAAAGALVMGSQASSVMGLPDVSSVDPMLSWGCALVAGGGVASAVHAASATVRAGATGISGGLLAPLWGLAESAMSILASVLAIVVPVLFGLLAAMVAMGLALAAICWMRRRAVRRAAMRPLGLPA